MSTMSTWGCAADMGSIFSNIVWYFFLGGGANLSNFGILMEHKFAHCHTHTQTTTTEYEVV